MAVRKRLVVLVGPDGEVDRQQSAENGSGTGNRGGEHLVLAVHEAADCSVSGACRTDDSQAEHKLWGHDTSWADANREYIIQQNTNLSRATALALCPP